MSSSCTRGGLDSTLEIKILHREVGQALEWAAQGTGGVPIPEDKSCVDIALRDVF